MKRLRITERRRRTLSTSFPTVVNRIYSLNCPTSYIKIKYIIDVILIKCYFSFYQNQEGLLCTRPARQDPIALASLNTFPFWGDSEFTNSRFSVV